MDADNNTMKPITITGLPIEKAEITLQIIAILVKKLGGEVLVNPKEEIKSIKGFIFQTTPHGNFSIKVE